MRLPGVALLLLLVLLVPARASAAPTWLPFETVSGANPGSGAADVAVAADGRAVVVWSSGSKVQANVRPPGGSWSGPVDLVSSGGDCCAAVAMDATGTAYAAYQACPSTCHVFVRTLPASAAEWTPQQQISSAVFPQDIGLAVDPTGNALIVWTHFNSGHYPTYARYRSANGTLGTEDLVTSGDAGCCGALPDVSMGGNGLAVVVWEFHPFNASSPIALESFVHGRTRTANGTWTPALASPAQAVGGPYQNNLAFDPHAASDPSGNALATWRAGDGTPLSRVVSPTGAWGAVLPIASTTGNTSQPWPAIDAAGTATAAWCEPAQAPATGWVVRVARAELGAPFGSPITISAPESSKCVPRAAAGPDGPGAGPDGGAGVVWRRSDAIIRANVMPPRGAFGAAHDLSTFTSGGANFNASIAFDGSGDALATWQRAGAVEVAAYDAAPPEGQNLSVPTAGTTNSPLGFSVSPFDIWSAPSASWDFGDGGTSTAASTSHAYQLAGKYDVTLTLTDAVGNATTVKRTIVITDPPGGTVIDQDHDGFPAGLDCDDSNPNIRPGGTEIPGNNIDEDCNHVAEPAPRITSGVKSAGAVLRNGLTRFDRLRVTDLPATAKVQLRCRGERCKFKRRTAKRGPGTKVNLLPLLGKRRTVRPGVRLEVWIRAPGYIGKVVRYKKTNRRTFPAGAALCVPLGATSPQKIC